VRDEDKTKEELLNALTELRTRNTELEAFNIELTQTVEHNKLIVNILKSSGRSYEEHGCYIEATENTEYELNKYREDLEKLVEARTKELNKANKELQNEIKKRQLAEKKLRAERRRLFSVLDGLPAQVYLIAKDYTFHFSNRFFQERFGNPHKNPCYKVFHGLTNPCENCPTFNDGPIKVQVGEYCYPDGYTYQVYDYPFIDVDGSEMLLSFAIDITDRKKTEQALQRSEEKFSKAFRCNPDPITITTLKEGRYVEVNNSELELTGYERHEIIGYTAHELGIWAIPEERELFLKYIIKYGNISNLEVKFRMKSREVRTFLLSAEIIDMGGEPHLLCVSKDITERKLFEEELYLSEERFFKAFNASPFMMTITNIANGELIDANHSFCSFVNLSREELLGRTLSDSGFEIDPTEQNELIKRLKEKESVRDMEIHFYRKNGEQRLGLYTAECLTINGDLCILSIVTDITERKKMETEMIRLDRLNMVGEIAASIGHEIRNPMTTVRGFLQIMRENGDYLKEKESFDLMIEELDRANSIITEFLSLAKTKLIELKLTNFNSIIKNIYPLVQASAMVQDKNVITELQDIPDVFIDEKEIRQLILNLVYNGLESMNPGGNVTLGTFMEEDSVILSIKDQGSGIDPDVLSKIGTPFFTTKEKGTGLGLAVCYGIATRHKAKIDIDTSSNGTTFFIRFPKPNAIRAIPINECN
jgi:PAS domain S-box-containing protein